MIRVGKTLGQLGLLAAMLVPATLITGCSKDAGTATVASTKPSPEESFKLIMETFERRMEDVQGFVSQQSGGHTLMMASNEVSSELIPPAREGEPYRAKVTVLSRSRYSIKRSTDTDDDADSEEQDRQADSTASTGANGVEILDPSLASGSSGKGRNTSEVGNGSVARRIDEDERTYDLEYRNGRWTLLTKTDPNTERSVQNAFDQALAMQL